MTERKHQHHDQPHDQPHDQLQDQSPAHPNTYPIGISDFKEIIELQATLVDKTLFIKELMEDFSKVILITRPRRFGKTLNMSMLSYFLDRGEKDIFDGLKIKQYPDFCAKHQNKYPVIFLTFKDIKTETFEGAITKLKSLFQNLYKMHMDVLESGSLDEAEEEFFQDIRFGRIDDPDRLSEALSNLMCYVHKKHGIAPIVILDEYDTPIQQAYMKKYYDEMVSFMRGLLGSALKDNKDLEKGILTGITRVSQESLFSGLNNLRVYTLLDSRYAPYFGFTEDEVISLLPPSVDIAPIRDWYNGYQVGGIKLYNPWSILSCLDNQGILKPYWVATSDNELVAQLIEEGNLYTKERFEKLLEGVPQEQTIKPNLSFPGIKKNENAVWTLLIYTGYLHVAQSYIDDRGEIQGVIAIPNKEVFCLYQEMIENWFYLEEQDLNYYKNMIKALESGDVGTFVEHIQTYINSTISFLDFTKTSTEGVFHGFIAGFLGGMRDSYDITSNRESGLGKYDLMLAPKKPGKRGIILEFKVAKTQKSMKVVASQGLAQILEKGYAERFLHSTEILVIGMAFWKKNVVADYKVVEKTA